MRPDLGFLVRHQGLEPRTRWKLAAWLLAVLWFALKCPLTCAFVGRWSLAFTSSFGRLRADGGGVNRGLSRVTMAQWAAGLAGSTVPRGCPGRLLQSGANRGPDFQAIRTAPPRSPGRRSHRTGAGSRLLRRSVPRRSRCSWRGAGRRSHSRWSHPRADDGTRSLPRGKGHSRPQAGNVETVVPWLPDWRTRLARDDPAAHAPTSRELPRLPRPLITSRTRPAVEGSRVSGANHA